MIFRGSWRRVAVGAIALVIGAGAAPCGRSVPARKEPVFIDSDPLPEVPFWPIPGFGPGGPFGKPCRPPTSAAAPIRTSDPFVGRSSLEVDMLVEQVLADGVRTADTRQQRVRAARLAFVDYYLVARQLELTMFQVERTRALRDEARRGDPAKAGTQQVAAHIEAELAELLTRQDELKRAESAAAARINGLWRRAADAFVPPPGPLPLPAEPIDAQPAAYRRPDDERLKHLHAARERVAESLAQWATCHGQALPAAQRELDASLANYVAGRGEILAVFTAQRRRFDRSMEELELLARFHKQLVDLDSPATEPASTAPQAETIPASKSRQPVRPARSLPGGSGLD